jgi:hypothetical protein
MSETNARVVVRSAVKIWIRCVRPSCYVVAVISRLNVVLPLPRIAAVYLDVILITFVSAIAMLSILVVIE